MQPITNLIQKTLTLCCWSIFFVIWITPSCASVSLLVEPDDGLKPILQAIQQAQTSIKIVPYMLTDGKIIDALKERALHGVRVQVMLEPRPYHPKQTTTAITYRHSYQPQETNKILNEAQISIHWSNPLISATRDLTHQKTIIIDHQKAFILTFNQTSSAYTYNREYGIIDTDKPDVAEIERVFDSDWQAELPGNLTNPNLLWSPINSRTKILELINSANKTLFIEIEEINDRQIQDALVAAADRGIEIKIIAQLGCTLAVKTDLIAIKHPNIAEKALYMHAKMIIADNERAYIGSINLSAHSLDYNRELGILIDTTHGYQEKAIIKKLNRTFLHDWMNV